MPDACAICQAEPTRMYHLARDGVRRTVHLCTEHGELLEVLIMATGTRAKTHSEATKVSDLKRSRAVIAREIHWDEVLRDDSEDE